MYGTTVATGEFAAAPSSSNFVPIDIFSDNELLVRDDVSFGNGFTEEDIDITKFIDRLFSQGETQNENIDIDTYTNEGRNAKKQNIGESVMQPKINDKKERRLSGTIAIMKETLDRLVATVENSKSKSSVTSTRTNFPRCSILEVLADVITLPGVDEKSDLYIFATELFEKRIKREVYTGFESQAAKLCWLQHHFNKQSK